MWKANCPPQFSQGCSRPPRTYTRAPVACLVAWERDTLLRQPQLFAHPRPALYTEALSVPAPAEFVTQVLGAALEPAKADCRKALVAVKGGRSRLHWRSSAR